MFTKESKRPHGKAVCGSGWSDRQSTCHKRPQQRRPKRQLALREAILSLEVQGLKRELSQVHRLLNMLVVLVDPADVKAALELQRITPTREQWQEMASHSEPPPELRGIQEEKPW